MPFLNTAPRNTRKISLTLCPVSYLHSPSENNYMHVRVCVYVYIYGGNSSDNQTIYIQSLLSSSLAHCDVWGAACLFGVGACFSLCIVTRADGLIFPEGLLAKCFIRSPFWCAAQNQLLCLHSGDVWENLPPGFTCVLAAFLFDAVAFIMIGVTRVCSREE